MKKANTQRFELSEAARVRASSRGEAGERWVASLAGTVASLESDWDIQVADSLDGGSESLVLAAQRADGTPVVLKLGMAGAANLESEAAVLRVADGRGYARLFEHDEARNAMLLERLGPPLSTLGLSTEAQLGHICTTLQTAWRPIEEPDGMLSGAQKARWLGDFIVRAWSDLGEPCAESTIRRACAFVEEREDAHDPEACVLVHGDAHEDNALAVVGQADEDPPGFKFVDPDGLFAEPAYDLGVAIRDWNSEMLADDALWLGRSYCEFVSNRTGVEQRSIWQWAFIERVSTGLHQMEIGLTTPGRAMLTVADRWSVV